MEITKAKEIVSLLANGIDPATGEIFPDNSPYNDPTVIRALFTLLGNVRSPKKQSKLSIEDKQAQNITNGKPRNAGLPWTEELKQEIAAMFKEGKPIDELSRHFKRTKGSILSELAHQGSIDQNDKHKYR